MRNRGGVERERERGGRKREKGGRGRRKGGRGRREGGRGREEKRREKRRGEGMSERKYVGTQLAFSFLFCLGHQLIGQCFPHSGWVVPPLFNFTECFEDTHKGVFPWRFQIQLS